MKKPFGPSRFRVSRHFSRAMAFVVLMAAMLPVAAAARRDPLNPKEVDQLREAAQEPAARLKLFLGFIRVRIETVTHLRSDPRFASDRAPQVHDLLEDVDKLVQEMDENIDMYLGQKADLRKPLRSVIEADSEFQLKLRSLKDSAAHDPAVVQEQKQYAFALDNAIESVNSSLDNARKLLEEQDAKAAEAKHTKKK